MIIILIEHVVRAPQCLHSQVNAPCGRARPRAAHRITEPVCLARRVALIPRIAFITCNARTRRQVYFTHYTIHERDEYQSVVMVTVCPGHSLSADTGSALVRRCRSKARDVRLAVTIGAHAAHASLHAHTHAHSHADTHNTCHSL
ncbi:hypothetical protein B5X24_HaOG201283 [Helicoverpa armigera]|nr:hypothetical protein B5X24_HaOG201283 [Helicoverpa armigera]